MVKVSVPGKIHLSGDYSSPFGGPAIIAAIDRRMVVRACGSGNCITINGERFDIPEAREFAEDSFSLFREGKLAELSSAMNSGSNFTRVCIGHMLNMLGSDSGVSFSIRSEIPRGAGLGSSSALCAAISGAMIYLFGNEMDMKDISDRALEMRMLMRGVPGGDVFACCLGGIIWFRKAGGNIEAERLDEDLSAAFDGFFTANTGRADRIVRRLACLEPADRNFRIRSMEDVAFLMRKAVAENGIGSVEELINREWGIVSSSCESHPLISRIRDAGGAARICAGGSLLARHKNPALLKEMISEAGYIPTEIRLGAEGISVED